MADYRKILVVVDLSDDSARIAERAKSISQCYGSRIQLLHVVEYVPIEPMGGDTMLPAMQIEGELLDEAPGALWTRALLDDTRVPTAPEMSRIVIGVDPPASADGDACGIIVCAVDRQDPPCFHVLADCSVSGLRPEGWARAVANAAQAWSADRVIAEKNQGGEMIGAMLRGVDSSLPVRLVAAVKSKAARAEPVALAFETGRARLAGPFPALEDQLCALTRQGYLGPGSPDRADAMVWAMSELIRPRREPRVVGL